MYKVLLVDDEPYVIEGLRTMGDWEKYGFVICGEATNGEDALEMLNVYDPDLVFTDIRMPAMDGLQLIKQAKEGSNSGTKFVILSGYDDFSYIQFAMRYGINDYLLKPIDDQELNTILANIGRNLEEQAGVRRQQALTFENSVKRILRGDINVSLINQVKNMCNFDEQDVFQCFLIEIDQYPDWLDKLDKGEIRKKKEKIKAVICSNQPCLLGHSVLEIDACRFCFIIQENSDGPHDYNGFVFKFQEIVKKELQCSVSVAYSQSLPGIKSIERLYRQTVAALEYKFFKGDGCLISYNDIKEKPLSYDFHNIEVNPLLEEIQHNASDGIGNQVDLLFQNFSKQKCTLGMIKSFIKNLELEVVKLVLEIGGDAETVTSMFLKFNQKMNNTTIIKLKTDFNLFCCSLGEHFASTGGSSKDIINHVKAFIKENYSREINLQSIARQFYMNPAYLGQLFKKYTGMQYSDFLHQIRIEEAKKLLRKTDMKITEIARVIGYHDPDYFVSKFKAMTRVSPSVYKKGIEISDASQ